MSDIKDCFGQELKPGDVIMIPHQKRREQELFFITHITGQSIVGIGECDIKGFFDKDRAKERAIKLTTDQVKTHLELVESHRNINQWDRVTDPQTGRMTWKQNVVSKERYTRVVKELGL